MNVVALTAGLLFLLAAPMLAGLLTELLFGIKKFISSLYLTGLLLFWAVFSLMYLAAFASGAGVTQLSKALTTPGIIVLLAFLLCLFFPGKRKRLLEIPGEAIQKLKEKKKLYLCGAVVYLLLAACIFSLPSQLHQSMYDGAERTAVIVTDGGQTPLRELAQTDPLTGEKSTDAGRDMLSRNMLPAFYAALCYMTGMTHTALLGCLIPLWVLLVAMLSAYHGAKALLGRDSRWLLAVFWIAAVFAATSYRNPFFDLLYLPHEARTWVAFFLLPEVFVILQRDKENRIGYYAAAAVRCGLLLLAAGCMGGFYTGILPVLMTGLLWEICQWISSRIF